MTRAALVVGINTYTHFRDLKAPAQDAEAISQRLQQDGDFKVTRLPEALIKENRQLRPAIGETLTITQSDLEEQLRLLFHPNSPHLPETVLFYFSGHGLRDPDGGYGLDKGYLATSDTDPYRPRSGISLAWLKNVVSRSPIQNQIIWLDCCHSGGLLIDAANPGQSPQQNRCFIASSHDYEKSWQDLNSPYSVLTKALLEGLDPARSPEEWVNTRTLVNYVKEALKGEIQSPVCFYFGEAINLTCSEQVKVANANAITADVGICPYKGLEFFDLNTEDPKYFFGRETLTDQLLDHVRTHNFMALVGASGNGKSSVLRAGLLHQLQRGRLVGSERWQILIMRPDAQPMKSLVNAFLPEDGSQSERADVFKHLSDGAMGLARLIEAAKASRVVLVVDQFEEAFTRCDDIAEREQFFACLMGALAEVGDKLCLVIAVRSDFVGKCLERDYSGLAQQVQANMVSVLPMQPAELRDAICQPAAQVGLTVEDALVTEMLDDIQEAPGSLPLLQYTLKELWQRRQDNQLVLSAYQALGGINGTLNQRATELYESFDAEQQRTVRHIFQQLTQLGEGTEDTRRRVFLDNLISEPLHPTKRVKTVVERLADKENRLLVTSEVVSKDTTDERRAIVDVAHEALIRHWRLLRQWIEQNRDLLRQQRRIEASAAIWHEHQNIKGYLLQNLPLDEAVQFQKQHAATFPTSDIAKSYIRKSLWQQRWNRFKVASLMFIPAAIGIGVVEHRIREETIQAHYAELASENRYIRKQATEKLVKGCRQQRNSDLPSYIVERIWGNCRPLSRVNLEEADLRGADLRAALLISASLSPADLSFADLSFADLRRADLRGANLRFTNFMSTYLRDANLTESNLSNANMGGVYGYEADLTNANLQNTILDKTNFGRALFFKADLSNTSLFEANLNGARLSNANLSGATLIDTQLRYAVLNNTVLHSAVLLTTDLRDVQGLHAQQLTGDKGPYLCNVALPDPFIDVDPDRDCENVPQQIADRYGLTLKEAQQFVQEIKVKQWD